MIKLNKDFFVRVLILLGVVFSFFISFSVDNKNGDLGYNLYPNLNFSFIDVAINKSSDTKYYSIFLGILFYLTALLLVFKNLKIHYLTLFFLFILLTFDIYFIYLVKQGEFLGQHLRLTIPMFLLILFSYKKNKK